MGNDGGSIPKRGELVTEAAKDPTAAQLKETILEKQGYLWTTDPLKNEALRPPIVSDCTGRLYNKESILEFLLPSDDPDAPHKKAEMEKILGGTVKSLRDIVEVKFEADSQDGNKWICPITGKPLGPASKAVYLVPCGHAFSESVVKEVTEEKCLQCNEAYAPNDAIAILPVSETENARLTLRIKILKEKGLTHSLKKAAGGKKRKKNVDMDGEKVPQLVKTDDAKNSKKDKMAIKNSSTASLTAKVLEEQEERNKKRKMQKNDNLTSLFTPKERAHNAGKKNDFFTRGFSIPGQGKG
ncbi:DUF602 domain-containing protein [Microthyrium microscopicum]|uniref:DUF602 domain-containing protein n=1 Tax=Microthyrium microscopicum TaxID=703497 RepID=A0A6A6UPZ7_9PEZI|nr:DUF602 domain-containing protein [Microthyrium microscopicum]